MISNANRKWWILTAMGGSLGLVVLDETIVGVALPTIRQDLAMSLVASHWIISAYLVVFTGLAAAAGKIGDLIDIKTFFVAGVSGWRGWPAGRLRGNRNTQESAAH